MPNPVARYLHNHIKQTLGKTVTQAAKELGVGRPALSNTLNSKAQLSVEMALKLEQHYGMDAAGLMAWQACAQVRRLRQALES